MTNGNDEGKSESAAFYFCGPFHVVGALNERKAASEFIREAKKKTKKNVTIK